MSATFLRDGFDNGSRFAISLGLYDPLHFTNVIILAGGAAFQVSEINRFSSAHKFSIG